MKNIIKYNALSKFIYEKYLDFYNKDVVSYVFVATTGRSGSATLTKILSGAENCVSLHEPYPIMLNENVEATNEAAYLSLNDRKVINIKRAAKNKKFYVETNHLFIKNFIDLVVQNFPPNKIKVIHLVRDPVKVARSFYAINSIPGISETGKPYLLDPMRSDNVIKLDELTDKNSEFSHNFYKCLWYFYEIEARVKKYQALYPQVEWFRLETESLNEQSKISELMSFLSIDMTPKIYSLVGSKENLKKDRKKDKEDEINLQAMHQNFLELLKEKGYR